MFCILLSLSPSLAVCYVPPVNIETFYVLSTERVYVVFGSHQKKSGYFPIQHGLTSFFYNEYVYCAVRIKSLNVIQVNFRL